MLQESLLPKHCPVNRVTRWTKTENPAASQRTGTDRAFRPLVTESPGETTEGQAAGHMARTDQTETRAVDHMTGIDETEGDILIERGTQVKIGSKLDIGMRKEVSSIVFPDVIQHPLYIDANRK